MWNVRNSDPKAVVKTGLDELGVEITESKDDESSLPLNVDDSTDDEGEDCSSSLLEISSCVRGCQHGIKIRNKQGEVWADPCKCTQSLSRQQQDVIKNAAEEIQKSHIPPLFANRTYNGRSFDQVVPFVLKQWLSSVCSGTPPEHSCIFLCGEVGNGKTHLASDCIKHFIMATGWQARYLTATELVEAKKNAVIYGDRKHRDDRSTVDYFNRVFKIGGLVVVDEIRDSISRTEGSYLEEFIDKRYQSGLPTIFISNHTFHRKTSYDGITIQQVLSKRITDRMSSSLYHEFTAASRRGIRAPESYTEEEMNSFCLPKSVLAQKEGELQILNWMTRNPIFEPINRRDRKVAVGKDGKERFMDGVPVDADRETKKVCHDVWQKGDMLAIYGPVLNEMDAKTYTVCLDILRKQHSQGKLGLTVGVNTRSILSALGKKSNTFASREATHRSLLRISLASISYIDNMGRQWTGPLFYFYRPDINVDYYEITFNRSMMIFYKTSEYTRLHRKLFDAKIGTDGVRMQMFLRSHKDESFDKLDVDGWMRFLEKPVDKMDNSSYGKKIRRQSQKRLSELIKNQVQAGLLTPDSTMKRNGDVILTTMPLQIPAIYYTISDPYREFMVTNC